MSVSKQLTAISYDSGNCRLYVKDQDGRKYVILDHGHVFEKNGWSRYELNTHSKCGEPCTPINVPWELVSGVEGSVFVTGLKHEAES
ncbi:hypothetical protein [Vibrio parahaemolyticus]|uniref:hypothetical protein n=1 Tax=Vibrio parahaemolyticus TaxID=670 RepID=UPI0023ED6CAA|nr:hypothetical protein [Vibrio parahaemolyticus]